MAIIGVRSVRFRLQYGSLSEIPFSGRNNLGQLPCTVVLQLCSTRRLPDEPPNLASRLMQGCTDLSEEALRASTVPAFLQPS